jgi:hypothetical protein
LKSLHSLTNAYLLVLSIISVADLGSLAIFRKRLGFLTPVVTGAVFRATFADNSGRYRGPDPDPNPYLFLV